MRLIGENLSLERGSRTLFRGLNFALNPGSLTRLTGPNGSGKTSLLRMIAGLGQPLTGRFRLENAGKSLDLSENLHFIGHQEAVKPSLTMLENLQFWQEFHGGEAIEAALATFGLEKLASLPTAWASEGQRRRLALSRLALVKRTLWLLDEPTVGLDTASMDKLEKLMLQHLAAGGIILAATHVSLPIISAELPIRGPN